MSVQVSALQFLSRPSQLLVGTDTGRVHVLDLARKSLVSSFDGLAGGPIRALACSRDSELLFASDRDGRALVWRPRTGETVDDLQCEAPISHGAVLGPHACVTVVQAEASLWSMDGQGQLVSSPLTGPRGEGLSVDDLVLAEQGLVLRSGFSWEVWEPERRARLSHHAPVRGAGLLHMDGHIGLSANGRFFYVYWDGASVLETATGARVRGHPFVEPAWSAALANHGAWLAPGLKEGGLLLLGPEGQAAWRTVVPGSARIDFVALSPDDALLVFVDAEGALGAVETSREGLVLPPERAMRVLAS